MDKFLRHGRVPSVFEGNKREPLMPIGTRWNGYGQVVLGASLERACETPAHLSAMLDAFPAGSPYLLSYRPDRNKVYVVLREKATKDDALAGAFLAHLWLRRIQESVAEAERKCMVPLPAPRQRHVQRHAQSVSDSRKLAAADTLGEAKRTQCPLWKRFAAEAEEAGWCLKGTMLAIGDTRMQDLPNG